MKIKRIIIAFFLIGVFTALALFLHETSNFRIGIDTSSQFFESFLEFQNQIQHSEEALIELCEDGHYCYIGFDSSYPNIVVYLLEYLDNGMVNKTKETSRIGFTLEKGAYTATHFNINSTVSEMQFIFSPTVIEDLAGYYEIKFSNAYLYFKESPKV